MRVFALALALLLSPSLVQAQSSGTSRLQYASPTGVQLAVGVIPLLVSGAWATRAIVAPIVGSNAGLGASTTYYVYAQDSGGTTVLNFSTTGHAVTIATTTSVEVKAGDATQTLVGMVATNASSQFQVDASHLWVLSWFSRRAVVGTNGLTANRTNSTTTVAEVGSEIRVNFLTWADEPVTVDYLNSGANSTGGDQNLTAIGIDAGTTHADSTIQYGLPANANIGFITTAYLATTVLAEGNHYATVVGANVASVGAGTATWYAGQVINGANTLYGLYNTLTVWVRG